MSENKGSVPITYNFTNSFDITTQQNVEHLVGNAYIQAEDRQTIENNQTIVDTGSHSNQNTSGNIHSCGSELGESSWTGFVSMADYQALKSENQALQVRMQSLHSTTIHSNITDSLSQEIETLKKDNMRLQIEVSQLKERLKENITTCTSTESVNNITLVCSDDGSVTSSLLDDGTDSSDQHIMKLETEVKELKSAVKCLPPAPSPAVLEYMRAFLKHFSPCQLINESLKDTNIRRSCDLPLQQPGHQMLAYSGHSSSIVKNSEITTHDLKLNDSDDLISVPTKSCSIDYPSVLSADVTSSKISSETFSKSSYFTPENSSFQSQSAVTSTCASGNLGFVDSGKHVEGICLSDISSGGDVPGNASSKGVCLESVRTDLHQSQPNSLHQEGEGIKIFVEELSVLPESTVSSFVGNAESVVTVQSSDELAELNKNTNIQAGVSSCEVQETSNIKNESGVEKKQKTSEVEQVQLLPNYNIWVDCQKLTMLLQDAASQATENAPLFVLRRLIPLVFSLKEMAASRGQGITTKTRGKDDAAKNPLDPTKTAACKDFMRLYCTQNELQEPSSVPVNAQFTHCITYSRNKLKRQSQKVSSHPDSKKVKVTDKNMVNIKVATNKSHNALSKPDSTSTTASVVNVGL